jgi:hypothetical protein
MIMLSRRQLLKQSAILAALSPLQQFALPGNQRFKIGACDWSLGKGSNIEAFALAKQIGLDGIMVDMGSLQNNLHLRNEAVQQAYLEESKKTAFKYPALLLAN